MRYKFRKIKKKSNLNAFIQTKFERCKKLTNIMIAFKKILKSFIKFIKKKNNHNKNVLYIKNNETDFSSFCMSTIW